MHNGRLCDPTYDITKKMKVISGKRDKTEADFEQMARLEFMGSLYVYNKKLIIPTEVFEATLVAGAKKTKSGKIAQAALVCSGNGFPLVYDVEQDQNLITGPQI
jgi:hypothetical protein